MSDLIAFLNKMGQDASLRYASTVALTEALAEAGLDATARRAVLSGDCSLLESLVGADRNFCCMVFPVEDDDDDENGECGH